MNVNQAKKLIQNFRSNYCESQPIDPQLIKLFVPALWGNNVVSSNSLHGKISRFLNRNASKIKQEKHVRHIFGNALKALHQHPQTEQEIPFSFRSRLDFALRQKKLVTYEGTAHINLSKPSEFDWLEFSIDHEASVTTEKMDQLEKEAQRLSFLHRPAKEQSSSLDLTMMSELFSERHTDKFEHYFNAFLDRNPEYATKRLSENQNLIHEGRKFNRLLIDTFFPKSQPLPAEIRSAELQTSAEKMNAIVKDLKPGQRWLFCGSFGNQKTNIEKLKMLASKLPKDFLIALPPIVQNGLQAGSLPEPHLFIDQLLQKGFEQAKHHFSNNDMAEILNSPIIKSLLHDDSREMTNPIGRSLPPFLKNGIESWLKAGLLTDVAEFVSDGESRNFMLQMAEAGNQLNNDAAPAERLFSASEKRVSTFLHQSTDHLTRAIDAGLSHFLDNIIPLLPLPILSMLDLDQHYTSGPLWIEITAQYDGLFTVNLYGTGSAISKHQSKSGQVEWPLRLTDVSKERLNEDLFLRVLEHHIEPKSNSKFVSRSDDLYDTITTQLQKTCQPSDSDEIQWRHVDGNQNSEFYLTQLLLINPNCHPGVVKLEMQCEALATFCKPFLKGKQETLTIDNNSTCSILEKALQSIEKDSIALRPHLENEKIISINATTHEIRIAINRFKAQFISSLTPSQQTAQLPPHLLTVIRDAAQRSGFSAEQLRSAKSTLSWALGEEIEDVVEKVAVAFEELPPAIPPTSAPQQIKPTSVPTTITKAPRGWLGTIFFHTYFSLALTAFRFVLLFTRIYGLGVGTLIMPVVKWGLSHIIPQFIQDWYAAIMSELNRRMTEIVGKLILKCFFSSEDAAQLLAQGQAWRKSIVRAATSMTNSQTISYELEKPLADTSKHTFFTISPSSNQVESTSQMKGQILKPLTRLEMESFPQERILFTLQVVLENAQSLQAQGQHLLASNYIISELEKLDIPKQKSMGFWDEVARPNTCFELLSDISILLASLPISYSVTEYGRFIVAQYSALTAMDRLARRDTDTLNNYKIYTYPLIHLLKRRHAILIDDPHVANRLEQVCAYCMPEIDLTNLPSNQTLLHLSKDRLFNYTQGIDSSLDSPEFDYLMDHLADPLVPEALKKQYTEDLERQINLLERRWEFYLSLIPELPESERTKAFENHNSAKASLSVDVEKLRENVRNFHKLSKVDLLHYLVKESSVFSRDKNTTLPRSYCLLRLHTLLCRHLCHRKLEGNQFTYLTSEKDDIELCKKNSYHSFQEIDPRSVLNTVLDGDFSKAYSRVIDSVSYPRMRFKDALMAEFTDDEMDLPFTQSEIMASSSRFGPRNMSEHMISCEPSDDIGRMIAHFQQYPDTFSFDFSFIYRRLFSLASLSTQLKHSPHFSIAIGEWLSELFFYTFSFNSMDTDSQYKLISLSINLKRYCEYHTPNHMHTFPDIRKHIESLLVHAEGNHRNKLIHFISYTYESNLNQLTLSQRRETAIALCRAYFCLPSRSIPTNSTAGVIFKYNEWIPEIKELLDDICFRNQMCYAILEALKIPFANSSDVWTSVESPSTEGWSYSSNDLFIHFDTGTVTSEKLPLQHELNQHQEVIKYFCKTPNQLQYVSRGIFQTLDRTFEFSFADKQMVYCRRFIDDKCYEYIPRESLIKSRLFSECIPNMSVDVWMEVTSTKEKEILIYHRDVISNERFKVSLNRHNEYELVGTVQRGSQRLQIIDPKLLTNALSGLTRFCSLSEIRCWGTPGQNVIKKFEIPVFKLNFNVDLSQGQPRAYSVEYPGFYIHPQQHHASLSGFSLSLLLTNQNGDMRVLLPSNQWLASMLWPLFSLLGPFASLLNNLIDQELAKQNKAYTYDLDANGSLDSEDPEALAYLFSLYCLQRNQEASNRTCTQIELLCKRKQVPQDITKNLLPLLIPFGYDNIQFMRQRIFAALEQNRLTRPTKNISNNKSQSPNNIFMPIEDIMTLSLILYDLQNSSLEKDPRKRLSDFQEWLLFKKAIHSLKNLTTSSFAQSNALLDITKSIGIENVIDSIMLQGTLGKRYRDLKERFGKKTSLSSRALNLATNVLLAPSSVPSLSLTPNVTPTPSQTLSTAPVDIAKFIKSYQQNDHSKLTGPLITLIHDTLATNPPLSRKEITPQSLIKYFLTYYAIARGEGSSEQRKKLSDLLPLIKGGWSPGTQLLIRYLELVNSGPAVFWKSNALQESLRSRNVESLDEFFQHINKRLIGLEAITRGASIAGEVILKTVVPGKVLSNVPVINLMSASPFLYPTLYWGSKVFNALNPEKTTASSTMEIELYRSPDYTCLAEDDHRVDSILNQLFQATFEEVHIDQKYQSDQKEIMDLCLVTNNMDPIEKAGSDKVNQSIEDFYKRENRQLPKFRLKGEEHLWKLYLNLITCRDKLKSQIIAEREKLIKLINTKNIATKMPLRADLSDLLRFFLKGNHKEFSEITGLSTSILCNLELTIGRHLIRSTRLQQIERALQCWNEFAAVNPNTHLKQYEQRLEKLALELRVKRNYQFDIPSRLLKRFIIFEFCTDKMLWERQVTCVQKLLLGKSANAILEMLMSLGKTYFGTPTTDSYEANGKQIIINIWPESMLETNSRQASRQGHQIFDQIANGLHFDRRIPFTAENFEAIAILFDHAKKHGETFNMSKTDAQALKLLFLEQLHHSVNGKKQNSAVDKEKLTQQANILLMLQTCGKVIGDEAHEFFCDTDELNWPVGPSVKTPLNLYNIIEATLRFLAIHPKFKKFSKEKNPVALREFVANEIIPYLADQLSTYWRFKLTTNKEREEFMTFVLGKGKTIPSWIQQSSLYGEMSLAKGILTILLPRTLARTVVDVDFGKPSNKEKGNYAHPCTGNGNTRDDSSIQNPFEAILKTGIMFLNKKLTPDEGRDVIHKLKLSMIEESKKRRIPPEETKAFIFFQNITGTSHRLTDPFTSDSQIFVNLCQHEDAILFYMRHFVWSQIRYWELNLRSDALDADSIFESGFYQTGTPYNVGVCPDHLELLLDPGTIGEALHILSKKCPKDGIHSLKSSNPTAVLQEILTTFFQQGSNFTAIVDGGAQLHGLSHLQVAQAMLMFVTQHRPDIRAIDFFMKNKEGVDQQMTLEVGSTIPIPYERCSAPLENRLSYFDQSHGFAADLPQKFNGKELLLVGSNHFLYRLLQEAFRFRGIKFFKQLLSGNLTKEELDTLNLTETQSIHFAMTPEVQKLITGTRIPTLQEIIEFTAKNESRMVAEHNYPIYRNKIHNFIRHASFSKIIRSDCPDAMLELFKQCEHIFVTRCDYDPKKLYGLIDDFIDTSKALAISREAGFQLLISLGIFSSSEQTDLRNKILAIRTPPMPLKVHVYTDGKTIHTNLLDNIGKSVQHEHQQENELEQELDSEISQSIKKQVNTHPFQEWEWAAPTNPVSTDWQKFQDPTQPTSLIPNHLTRIIRRGKDLVSNSIPPLFKVRDLLNHSANPRLRKVAKLFDDRIWMSNNFLPQYTRHMNEESASIGSSHQRERYKMLIHINSSETDMKIRSAGCLSIKEGAFWEKLLARMEPEAKQRESHDRVILYDTSLRVPVAGHYINLNLLRNNPELMAIETAVKLLNGDVQYKHHMPSLKSALQQEDVRTAFYEIHRNRGKESISGSDIDRVLSQYEGIPLEDQL